MAATDAVDWCVARNLICLYGCFSKLHVSVAHGDRNAGQ